MSDSNMAESLRTADEVFMRCAPMLAYSQYRSVAAEVIERDKADLLEVLGLLADGLDGHSRINIHTGTMECIVEPEFFGKLRRALLRHANRRVLEGVRV